MTSSPRRRFPCGALLALQLCLLTGTQAQPVAVADCSNPEPFLAAAGAPAYPPFEVSPRARPAAATLLLEERATEVFLYSAAPGDDSGGGRLVAADARSGALLWDSDGEGGAPLMAAVEHSPAVLRTERGVAYRAYFGDGAGGLWRLDLPPGPTAAWRLSRFAELAALSGAAGSVALPVAPDLFHAVDGDGRAFDGLVLAALVAVEGQRRIDLVVLRDYALGPDGAGVTLQVADLTDLKNCETRACAPPATGPGWYLTDAAPGDALAVAPLIDGGRIFLATHERLSRTCDSAGVSAERFLLLVDLQTAEPLPGGGRNDAFSLGRQLLDGPRPARGRIHLPGFARALAARGFGEDILAARGLTVTRRYWLDLLLDAE